MSTEAWVFLNGNFYPESQASIPITDRGFLFGDGIFTTMRVHDGRCELFSAHLNRLQQQAIALNFALPPILSHAIDELICRNQAQKGIWRLKIIVTASQQGCNRFAGNTLMTLQPYLGESWKPSSLCYYPHPIDRHLAHLKSLSYLDYLYVREYAKQQNSEDAIIRTREGILLETSCSNLFWIDQGVCYIPDFELPYLKGVCLKAIVEHLPLPLQFVKATMKDIPPNSCLYTCNALSYVRPVLTIENQPYKRDKDIEDLLFETLTACL